MKLQTDVKRCMAGLALYLMTYTLNRLSGNYSITECAISSFAVTWIWVTCTREVE